MPLFLKYIVLISCIIYLGYIFYWEKIIKFFNRTSFIPQPLSLATNNGRWVKIATSIKSGKLSFCTELYPESRHSALSNLGSDDHLQYLKLWITYRETGEPAPFNDKLEGAMYPHKTKHIIKSDIPIDIYVMYDGYNGDAKVDKVE